MNKFEVSKSTLHKIAFSMNSLLVAYNQIKSKPGKLMSGEGKEMSHNINFKWFKTSSDKLLRSLFVYPKMRRISISKESELINARMLTLISPRIKIIERSILNAVEPVFEGQFIWKSINKSEYEFIKKNSSSTVVVCNKSGYFKKDWVKSPVFSRFSFGFRPSRSVHSALYLIKTWATNLSWFLKFDFVKAFDAIHKNRLKNIFLKYCPDKCIWNNISQLFEVGVVDLKIISVSGWGVSQGSVLSPFLFNVYMTELDHFIESLKLKNSIAAFTSRKDSFIKNEYEQFVRKFRTKKGLAVTLVECGSASIVLTSYRKKVAFFKKQGLI
jgi:hypothetical protein